MRFLAVLMTLSAFFLPVFSLTAAPEAPSRIVQGATVRATPDMAPNPAKQPRTPVMAQTIDALKDLVPGPKPGDLMSGSAEALDGELLRLNDTVVRLFGIVPPQLSASFGPQARAALDKMVRNQVTGCVVRDRDREGRLLASCATTQTSDLALAMIQQGLAVVARGTVRNADFAKTYTDAEAIAQAEGLGLWAGTVEDAENPAVSATAPKPVTALFAPQQQTNAQQAQQIEAREAQKPNTAVLVEGESMKLASPEQASQMPAVAPSQPARAARAQQNQQIVVERADRSWVLPVALLFIYIFASTLFQVWQKQDNERRERRAVAAALRGELTAARAICLTRAEALAQDIMSGRSVVQMTWPRIRSTVYQAHVDRIGMMGADLARKVSSLYGQLSDYAAYFGAHAVPGAGVRADATGTRQVLLTLVSYIDVTSESLAETERTGFPAKPRALTLPTLQDQQFENNMAVEQTQQNQYVTSDGAQVTPLRRQIS